MIPSDKQIKIYNEWEETTNNLAIEAAPGSGKTTTLIELLKRTPPTKKAIFLAFNKSIQLELQEKVPSGVETSTLHSLGYRTLLRNTNQRYKLTELKNWIIGKKILKLKQKTEKQKNVYLFILSRLVDLYRLNLCENKEDLEEIADKYNISTTNGEIKDTLLIIEYLEEYNRQYHEKEMMIDFVDMLYLPTILLSKADFPKYHVVMIDESQDLNLLQWKLIQNLFRPRSRFVSVGDKYQAIYSFQGADRDVFEKIKGYPNTTVLPLSYSYRCPVKVVERANKVFNFIESPDWKEQGEVRDNGSIYQAQPGDFILCRNNAPLVETFLKLLKNGIKCRILGKDYGKGLLNVLNKITSFEKEEIDQLLNRKREELIIKGVKNPTQHQTYQNLVEKVFILEELHKEFKSESELRNIVEEMFSDSENYKDSVTLSTIHKSKGLEADNVFLLLMNDLLPSKYAETELEKYAERCLEYVAITRAKKKLMYVHRL